MRLSPIAPLVLLVLAVGLLSSGPQPAGADEGPQGMWVYDIHLVRVDTTTPEVVEAAPAFLGAGTTVTESWAALLAKLKDRGQTTVLLDQRITSLPGSEILVRDTGDRQIEQFSRRDRNNETWQSSTLSSGASVKLKTTDHVAYSIEFKWMLDREEGELRPLLSTASWSGMHTLLDGRTLALRYAKQVRLEHREPRGVELYAFVTGRLAP